MGIEEEPSAEEDDDAKASLKTSSDTPAPATKKDAKKATTLASVRTDVKEVEKTDGLNQDEDEARIEKELAEIYKDTADYKTDGSEEKEVAKEPPATVELVTVDKEQPSEDEESDDTPIERQRSNFRFQPDSTDKASVERFRTSVDDISCNNRQKLSGTVTVILSESVSNDAFRTVSNGIILITLAMLSYVFICA